MKCAVYRPETGEIMRTVLCAPGQMEVQARGGEAVCEVAAEVRDDTHRIVDGRAVEKE